MAILPRIVSIRLHMIRQFSVAVREVILALWSQPP